MDKKTHKLAWASTVLVTAGCIGLLQVHGIRFWTVQIGPIGWAWSVLLELAALWLWWRRSVAMRSLGLLASVLLLAGPLYQVGSPLIEDLMLAEHTDRSRDRLVPMLESEIATLERQLAAYTANSKHRAGWLPSIEETAARLSTTRARLADLYVQPPAATEEQTAQRAGVIAMQLVALVLFQVTAVLGITAMAQVHERGVTKLCPVKPRAERSAPKRARRARQARPATTKVPAAAKTGESTRGAPLSGSVLPGRFYPSSRQDGPA